MVEQPRFGEDPMFHLINRGTDLAIDPVDVWQDEP